MQYSWDWNWYRFFRNREWNYSCSGAVFGHFLAIICNWTEFCKIHVFWIGNFHNVQFLALNNTHTYLDLANHWHYLSEFITEAIEAITVTIHRLVWQKFLQSTNHSIEENIPKIILIWPTLPLGTFFPNVSCHFRWRFTKLLAKSLDKLSSRNGGFNQQQTASNVQRWMAIGHLSTS